MARLRPRRQARYDKLLDYGFTRSESRALSKFPFTIAGHITPLVGIMGDRQILLLGARTKAEAKRRIHTSEMDKRKEWYPKDEPGSLYDVLNKLRRKHYIIEGSPSPTYTRKPITRDKLAKAKEAAKKRMTARQKKWEEMYG